MSDIEGKAARIAASECGQRVSFNYESCAECGLHAIPDSNAAYMKIYFDDPEYDGQFLRAVDYAPAGAQIGEAWAIAAQIQAGDKTSWYNEWSSYADRLYELAVKSRDAGHRVSARNAFLRASNYYRTAYIFMFAVPVDPRVVDAYEKQTDAFRKAAELFERPIEVLKIP